ncbi:MAG: pneumococcal-type histidine triad protein [Eubacteriales bacterium]|nr:pneumococcal-type histidine triad protein [Eubacteriales bacterium]
MAKKRNIIIGSAVAILLGGGVTAGYCALRQPEAVVERADKVEAATPKKAEASDKKVEKKKKKEVIVTYITSDGYSWLHGDHSHFKKGRVPYDAKFVDEIVYNNPNYVLRDEDIQYEVAEGYIIKVDGEYYYYPKKNVKQTKIVSRKEGETISRHQTNGHAHHEDGYQFNPADIVEENAGGVVVRHGDHFHFIKYSELTSHERQMLDDYKKRKPQVAPAAPVTPSVSIPTKPDAGTDIPGVTKPTDDGFLFDGTGIVAKTANGLIVQHGNHTHYIYYTQLAGTKWAYLIPQSPAPQPEKPKPPAPQPEKPKPPAPEPEKPKPPAPQPENPQPEPTPEEKLQEKINYLAENFHCKPEDIKIDGEYFIVPHGDHYHSYRIEDIDPSKPFEDPHGHHHEHQKTGMETLKAMGFDDEIIHSLLHANADTDFPAKETNVDKMKQWLAGVRAINIGEIKDPLKRNGLSYLTGLRLLAVGYTPIDDISPVLQFKELKHLWIPNTGISDFTFLEKMPNLIGVDISQLNLSSIDFLKKHKNLTSISAAGNHLTNIDVLAEMPNLETLNFDYNELTDLSPLLNADKLHVISFEHNRIADLSPLNNKPVLEKLFIGDNPDVHLGSMTSESLAGLVADNIKLYDLDFLKNMPNLKQLSVKGNYLRSLDGVEVAKQLTHLYADKNHIERLGGASDSLEYLSVNDNEMTDMEAVTGYKAMTNMEAANNKLIRLSGLSETLKTLNVKNNAITTLQGVNAFKVLESLDVSENFIKTMAIDAPNKTIEFMDISYNPLGELTASQTPDGLDSFENLKYGGYLPAYTLNKEHILSACGKLRDKLTEYKNRIPKERNDEFLKQIRSIELDVAYAVKQDDALYQKNMKELGRLEAAIKEVVYSTPEPDAEETPEETPDEHAGETHEGDSTTAEDGFHFKAEDVTEETEDGFVVRHGDHFHYVFKKDLTEEQIAAARKVLAGLTGNEEIPAEEIAKKKEYVALYENINAADIQLDGHVFRYTIDGTEKAWALKDITIPEMSDNLEADFEAELTKLATAMHMAPENIGIQDGYMIVDHGDHQHRYRILSPGWRAYLKNRIPAIDIPSISGELDRGMVSREIARIRNRADAELTPLRAKRIKKWLQNFEDVDLAWAHSATEGYLTALRTLEESQFGNSPINPKASDNTSNAEAAVKPEGETASTVPASEERMMRPQPNTNSVEEAKNDNPDSDSNTVPNMAVAGEKILEKESSRVSETEAKTEASSIAEGKSQTAPLSETERLVTE